MWLTIRPEELDIETRQLDTLFWSYTLGRSPSIRKVLKRRADKVIGGDIFNALYQWNPKLKDSPPDPALAAWLANTMQQPSFEKLRSKTVGDRSLAAAATVRLYKELMRPQDSMIKAVAQLKDHLDHATVVQSIADVDCPDVTPADATGLVDTVKQAQEKLGEAIESSLTSQPDGRCYHSDHVQCDPPDVLASTRALQNTTADLEMATSVADFDSGGKGANLDPTAQGERVLDCLTDESIISKVTASDSLRKIFQVAGRMSIILQQAKSKKPRLAPPPVSLTYGNDLSSVLSLELASLADPELEDIFWLKFLEGGLLQYDRKGRVNEGLGPFICCMDYSGSMRGQPLEYAKGLFVALARMAVAKRRKIVFIPFATKAGKPEFITSGLELVTILSYNTNQLNTPLYNLGGGTLFEPPLAKAGEIIASEAVYKHADVLFITDGYSILYPDWIQEYIKGKQQLGFRLIGVNIMGTWDKAQLPMFDATVSMGSGGELSKLEWLSNVADRMV